MTPALMYSLAQENVLVYLVSAKTLGYPHVSPAQGPSSELSSGSEKTSNPNENAACNPSTVTSAQRRASRT